MSHETFIDKWILEIFKRKLQKLDLQRNKKESLIYRNFFEKDMSLR